MLEELRVTNFALIDQANVEFSSGLNVLSGETGAGKSMLAGALGLLMGGKASLNIIQEGKKESNITGIIKLASEDPDLEWLQEKGIVPEDQRVIVQRVLRRSGRNSYFIQSIPVTKTDMSDFMATRIDIHSQHEHQSLLKVEKHLELLDRFGRLEPYILQVRQLHKELSNKKQQLQEIIDHAEEKEREKEQLESAISEIESASLDKEEEQNLSKELRILSDFEKIFGLLGDFRKTMEGSENTILLSLKNAQHLIPKISQYDPELNNLEPRFEQAYFEIEDISETLFDYQRNMNFSPERLNEIQERLNLIKKLERKYSCNDIASLLNYRNESQQKVSDMEFSEENQDKLSLEIKKLENTLGEAAEVLTQKRLFTGKTLKEAIEDKLVPLGMESAVFEVSISPRLNEGKRPVCAPNGKDFVEFLISANPGISPQPLHKIASGGEISRIMLAIKTILAKDDFIETLVFDEVDTGIGGEVSVAVGKFLRNLAKKRQVLSITHLASIAVYADNHIKVSKRTEEDNTLTSFSTVSGKARVEEIARMLAGDSWDQKSLAHAEEMLGRKM